MDDVLNIYSLILILLALLVEGTILFIDDKSSHAIPDNLLKTIFTIVITVMAVGTLNVIVVCCFREAKPSAEDVLSGDAIIKYEIVDGVKTDSCYVYKRKYINE